MKKLNILIVDDEPVAQRILELHLSGLEHVHLAGICNDCTEALAVMKQQSIDLLLLDINMPGMSGIDLMRALGDSVAVIFTTAYNEFAIESYELNAIDYLLKPISRERLITAIRKMEKQWKAETAPASALLAAEAQPEFLFVKQDGKLHKVVLSELWLIESKGDYLKLFIGDKALLTYSSMKNFEKRLERNQEFLRVNKSTVINMNYISEIEGNCLTLKDKAIVVGLTYRQEVSKKLDAYMP